ncbi:PaaI family thioesterase [Streptomyces aureocirculatus]|uniref:PaaI family thioesterase n=1 Tax=Streptomyces aureocirculatus TaxID=67275 RepID=UPI00068E3503|nr:PaaI family thioesterase [Streptomyces aureocirculatus]
MSTRDETAVSRRTYSFHDPSAQVPTLLGMDGLQLLRGLQEGSLSAAPLESTLDYRVVEVDRGSVTIGVRPREWHGTHSGNVHGGLIASVADAVCGYAVQTHLPAGSYAVTAKLCVSFLHPVSPGRQALRCVGSAPEPEQGCSQATAELVDPNGKVLAEATATVRVLSV